MLEHQDIFDQPVEEMVKGRSPHYLLAWTNMFYALVLLSDRRRKSGNPVEEDDDSGSVATFDTWYDEEDRQEYLVDATEGMEREWELGQEGAELTSPQPERERNPYIRRLEEHGALELKKRKPPDEGKGQTEDLWEI